MKIEKEDIEMLEKIYYGMEGKGLNYFVQPLFRFIDRMKADLEKPTETTKGTIEAPTAEEVSWAIDTIETLARVEKCEQEYTADEQHPSAKIGISDEIKTKLYTKEMQPNCTEPLYSSEPVPKQYHYSRMDYFYGIERALGMPFSVCVENAKEAIKQIDEL